MSNNTPKPKRPSTARVHTRTSEQNRTSELDQGVKIKYGDEVYQVTAGDLSALDALAMRREVGMSFNQVVTAMKDAPDIDLVAVIIWLARRAAGEKTLRFETVAEEVTYDEVAEKFDTDYTGEDDPEPPGESQPGDD